VTEFLLLKMVISGMNKQRLLDTCVVCWNSFNF